jgi:fibronectin-binding autotransporter adhesin
LHKPSPMKPSPNPFRCFCRSAFYQLGFTLVFSATAISGAWAANDLYWDSDGTTAGGSSGNTAVGTWGTSVFWNTNSGGGAGTLTETTTNLNDLHFSASTDVSGNYTVTVDGNQSANLLIFEEGAVTLEGGSITLGGGGGVDTGIRFANNVGATTVNSAVILAVDGVFTNLDNTTQTITGGVTGNFNLTLNANSTGGLALSTNEVNNGGTVTISGTGAGGTTLSGGIGSNVTGVLVSRSGSGGTTLSGALNLTGNVLLNSSGTGATTISGALNLTGGVTNSGTGSGLTTISGVVGSTVTGIVQDSQTSALRLTGNNSSYTGGIYIKSGTVTGATSTNAFGTGTIRLGDDSDAGPSNNASATLILNYAGVYANDVVLGKTSGALTISTPNTGTEQQFTGSISGTNDLLISNTGTRRFRINTAVSKEINHTGTITNIGTGTGMVEFSGAIGSNVTGVVQNSATSQLRFVGNKSFGSLVINAGSVEGEHGAGATTSLGLGTVTLGGSGTDSAALFGFGNNADATFGNAIVLGTTTGTLTIGAQATERAVTFTGGITGNNDIHFTSGSNTAGLSPVTFSGGAINNAGKIINSTVTGTSEIFVSSLIGPNVTEVVQNSATAGMTLSGNQTYVVPITVTAGTLSLGEGASLGDTTVTVTNGTFRAMGNQTFSTSGSELLNIGDNSTFSLQSGGINTVLLNGVTPGTTVLDFNGTTGTFAVDISGSSADLLQIGAGHQVGLGANPIAVNINVLQSLVSGSRTILTADGGLLSGGGFALDTTEGNFGGSTILLTNLGTSLVLNITEAAASPSILYFTGALDNNFATFAGGNENRSNFSTDAAGLTDAHAAPDAGTELHIHATSLASAARTLTLGRNVEVKSLFIDAQVANALTLASGTADSFLRITPTSSTGGITVNSSAGGTVNISAPIILGANQTFMNNSANLLTVSGGISGTADLTVKGNTNGGVTFSGTASNTYNGTTTVSSGSLTLSKTGGATAIAGDVVINGGNLSFGGNDQIADTASVTLTSGTFNTTSGAPNVGRAALNEKFASLSVSGDGHFNNGNNSAASGIEVTGNASFTGGAGASFFSGSGGTFSAGSLTLTNMSRNSSPATGTPSMAQIADGFIVFGNNAKQSTVAVGSGGLRMEGTAAESYLVLRAGSGGSKLTLDGDVTSTGTHATGIVFDITQGTTGGAAVHLSGTVSDAVTRRFDVGAGGNFTVGAVLANGASSSASLRKTSEGTMIITSNSTFTGETLIEAGTLQLGVGGNSGILASATTVTISEGARLRTSRNNTTNLTYAISGAGSLEVANTGAAGITNLTTTNKTYSGDTIVTGGTLNVSTELTATSSVQVHGGGTVELGSANRIVDSASLSLLNGGTFNTRGLSEIVGVLSLTGANNTLNLAAGASILQIANSSGAIWGGGLNILNWSGTADTGGGTDQVIFGDNTSALLDTQLASIFFINPFGDGNDYDAKWSTGMNGEIVPGIVIPEPSGVLLVSIGGIGLAMRRRRK